MAANRTRVDSSRPTSTRSALLAGPDGDPVIRNTCKTLHVLGIPTTTVATMQAAVDIVHANKPLMIAAAEPAGPWNSTADEASFHALLHTIENHYIAGLIFARPASELTMQTTPWVQVVDRRVTLDELRGRLAAMAHFQSLLREFSSELDRVEALGEHVTRHFAELDTEMQLAARLQTDFLPKSGAVVGKVGVTALFRPATFVSGDTYDVFPIGAQHIGFYIADAVGHGVAAGLLTMFIRRAIVAAIETPGAAEVRCPSDVLAGLNDALAMQHLPNNRFVTAFYGVLNQETLELQFARGGHPIPILLRSDGTMIPLESEGGLLGLAPGERPDAGTIQLRPLDKLLLYTDGLDSALPQSPSRLNQLTEILRPIACFSANKAVSSLETCMDNAAGSLNPLDDTTVLCLEIAPEKRD